MCTPKPPPNCSVTMASDSSYSVAVDYAAMFRVLDPGWAADIIPDDNAGRSAELPLVVDEEGEDIFERA